MAIKTVKKPQTILTEVDVAICDECGAELDLGPAYVSALERRQCAIPVMVRVASMAVPAEGCERDNAVPPVVEAPTLTFCAVSCAVTHLADLANLDRLDRNAAPE